METDPNHLRLQKVFRDIFDNQALEINRQSTAQDIEEWDSLGHINLIVATEKEFKIRFSTAEIRSMRNVGELLELIGEKKKI